MFSFSDIFDDFWMEGCVQDIGHSALNIPQSKPNDGESLDSYRESVQIET